MKSKVWFTRAITPEKVVEMYEAVGHPLSGKVGCKVHSGEVGNQNFLRPAFWKPIVDRVGGTVIECNTAYEGERNETAKHLKALRFHGWDMSRFDLMDAEGPDHALPVENGRYIHEDYVGRTFPSYDSFVVLTHFKGHPMGGYGGALKQLSIGFASSYGKACVHGAGDPEVCFDGEQNAFLETMAEAAGAVVRAMKGNVVYINVMKNMSVDCDCCAVAEDPCMRDIGILASLDPIAIDQACLDLVYAATDDPGQGHLIERIESQNGVHTIERAAELGFGSRDYELIEVK